MNTITTSILPPSIQQDLDLNLLSKPKWRFDAEYLRKIAQWIEKRIDRAEFKRCVKTRNDIYLKYMQFMELYEQAKTKEKESKEKTSRKISWPFYRPRLPNKNDQRIYQRLNDRRKTSERKLRKNSKI